MERLLLDNGMEHSSTNMLQNIAVAPPTKLLGEQLVHPAPRIFFCNLQLKVTYTGCKVTFDTKILKIPQLLGLCPRPHCTLRIPFSKNTYCIKLHFEFHCLDWFSPIFASATEKSFNFCSPNRKIVPAPMLQNLLNRGYIHGHVGGHRGLHTPKQIFFGSDAQQSPEYCHFKHF